MKHTQEVTIEVNGKTITATVQVDAPGLVLEDCVSGRMILSAVASGQRTEYRSRHHKDRVAVIDARGIVHESEVQQQAALRLVA
jgi:hypothetical protein